jgi:hypothetical protein
MGKYERPKATQAISKISAKISTIAKTKQPKRPAK